MSNEPDNGMQWLLTPLEGVQHGSSSIDGMGSAGVDAGRAAGQCEPLLSLSVAAAMRAAACPEE